MRKLTFAAVLIGLQAATTCDLGAAIISGGSGTASARAGRAGAPPPPHPGSKGPIIKAQDTKGTPDERAEQMLKQMTLQEKCWMLGGASYGMHGLPELGILELRMADGPMGVRNPPPGTPGGAPFPSGAALAATFEPKLAFEYGKALGLEARARGVQFQLGPAVNLCRMPTSGRAFECYGEDPYLAGIMAVGYGQGMNSAGVVPVIKHFVANNEEIDRSTVSVVVDERALHEIYFPAFKRAVQNVAHIEVMSSPNRLNDVFNSNNKWLLTDVLRKAWGFKGFAVSDWGASHDVTDVAAGLDLEQDSGVHLNFSDITAAIKAGTVKESDVDRAVRCQLREMFEMGYLEAGYKPRDTSLPMDSDYTIKTVRAVAEAGVVLLKNVNHALPLDRAKVKNIVVIGTNASAATGGWFGYASQAAPAQVPLNISGGGRDMAWPVYANRIPDSDYYVGIKKAAGADAHVTYMDALWEKVTGAGTNEILPFARTSANGRPGLTATVKIAGETTSSFQPWVETNIDLAWQAGQPPMGLPRGRDATITYTGVLVSPTEADMALRVTGSPTITLGGRKVVNDAVFHLAKNEPISIQIALTVQSNPTGSTTRRFRGRGAGLGSTAGSTMRLRVGLRQPKLRDSDGLIKKADAVIVVAGFNRHTEAEGLERPFELPQAQRSLIWAVAAMNPHTIVVNNSGAAMGMSDWLERPDAILQAWYLGLEGGVAIGRLLFGDVNPSGKLVSSWDHSMEDNPAWPNYPGSVGAGVSYPTVNYEEGIFVGYRGYDKAKRQPLFPFGYGLSYTTFEYSNLKLATNASKTGTEVNVSLDVKNTGSRAGADVVQVYVGEQGCPLPRPLRELKGFQRVNLDPGETKRVEITLPGDSFAYYDPGRHAWAVDNGKTFTIEVGQSEQDIKLSEELVYRYR